MKLLKFYEMAGKRGKKTNLSIRIDDRTFFNKTTAVSFRQAINYIVKKVGGDLFKKEIGSLLTDTTFPKSNRNSIILDSPDSFPIYVSRATITPIDETDLYLSSHLSNIEKKNILESIFNHFKIDGSIEVIKQEVEESESDDLTEDDLIDDEDELGQEYTDETDTDQFENKGEYSDDFLKQELDETLNSSGKIIIPFIVFLEILLSENIKFDREEIKYELFRRGIGSDVGKSGQILSYISQFLTKFDNDHIRQVISYDIEPNRYSDGKHSNVGATKNNYQIVDKYRNLVREVVDNISSNEIANDLTEIKSKTSKKKRGTNTAIRVEIDGRVIKKESAVLTFVDAINFISNKVGVDKFMEDNLDNIMNRKIIGLDVTEFPEYAQNQLRKNSTNQFYISSHNSTYRKRILLEYLFKKYNINGKVFIEGEVLDDDSDYQDEDDFSDLENIKPFSKFPQPFDVESELRKAQAQSEDDVLSFKNFRATEPNERPDELLVFNNYIKNPFSQAICVLGESGAGKSTTVDNILQSSSHVYQYIIPSASTTGLLSQFSPSAGAAGGYIPSRLGQMIEMAYKNKEKNYTAVFDECHKTSIIEMINDELLQAISKNRNKGVRFISLDDDTRRLFPSAQEDSRGNVLIPDNFGFIFISSNARVIAGNPDFFNRVDLIELTEEDRKMKTIDELNQKRVTDKDDKKQLVNKIVSGGQ